MPRRIFVLTLSAMLAFGGAVQAAHAKTDWRAELCRYRHLEGGTNFTTHEVELTIACAVRKWPVSGGLARADKVAQCESGYNELSRNASSTASGVYQMLSSTWTSWYAGTIRSRSHAWQERWRVRARVFNARANVIVAIIHAHRHGWGAWAASEHCWG